jgi:hypothetical protein
MLGSFAAAGIALLVAGATFGYQQYEQYLEVTKANELKQKQDSVSPDTVKEYVRLRDRFTAARTLINQHIMLSHYFDDLEGNTLENIQFSDLTLTVAGDGTAKIQMNGIAKNFNALAAQSNAVASDTKFKRAIFSNIGFDTTAGNASRLKFTLTAEIDPTLIKDAKTTAAVSGATIPAALTAPLPQAHMTASSTQSAPFTPVATTTSTTTKSTSKPAPKP